MYYYTYYYDHDDSTEPSFGSLLQRHTAQSGVLFLTRTAQCTKCRARSAPNSIVQKHSRSLSLTDAAECVEVRTFYITEFSVCVLKKGSQLSSLDQLASFFLNVRITITSRFGYLSHITFTSPEDDYVIGCAFCSWPNPICLQLLF